MTPITPGTFVGLNQRHIDRVAAASRIVTPTFDPETLLGNAYVVTEVPEVGEDFILDLVSGDDAPLAHASRAALAWTANRAATADELVPFVRRDSLADVEVGDVLVWDGWTASPYVVNAVLGKSRGASGGYAFDLTLHYPQDADHGKRFPTATAHEPYVKAYGRPAAETGYTIRPEPFGQAEPETAEPETAEPETAAFGTVHEALAATGGRFFTVTLAGSADVRRDEVKPEDDFTACVKTTRRVTKPNYLTATLKDVNGAFWSEPGAEGVVFTHEILRIEQGGKLLYKQ